MVLSPSRADACGETDWWGGGPMYGSNCLGNPSVPEGELPPWSVMYRRVYVGGEASKGQHSPFWCFLGMTEIGGGNPCTSGFCL